MANTHTPVTVLLNEGVYEARLISIGACPCLPGVEIFEDYMMWCFEVNLGLAKVTIEARLPYTREGSAVGEKWSDALWGEDYEPKHRDYAENMIGRECRLRIAQKPIQNCEQLPLNLIVDVLPVAKSRRGRA